MGSRDFIEVTSLSAIAHILEHRPGQTRRMPVSSRSILAPTWPQRLSDAGRTVLLLNVPLTYPPLPLQGVVISGGVIPPKAVYSHPARTPRARQVSTTSRNARSAIGVIWNAANSGT